MMSIFFLSVRNLFRVELKLKSKVVSRLSYLYKFGHFVMIIIILVHNNSNTYFVGPWIKKVFVVSQSLFISDQVTVTQEIKLIDIRIWIKTFCDIDANGGHCCLRSGHFVSATRFITIDQR